MKFNFALGPFLIFVLSGCLTVHSPQKPQALQSPQAALHSTVAANKNDIFTQACPDGLLHFVASVATTSTGISGAFSITPAGEVIQTLLPDILPSSIQNSAGLLRPAWSEKDRKIVFAHTTDGNHQWAIYVMDSDGKNLNIIYTAEPNKQIYSPIWSASSRKIYFLLATISEKDPADVTLCTIFVNGKGFAEIAALSYPGTPLILKLSPDEQHTACIYFDAPTAHGEEKPTYEYAIHVIHTLNGSEQIKVAGFDLAWSPDSKSIAVIKEESAIIQITDISTGEIKIVPTGARLPMKIAWKPDGSELAYISRGKPELHDGYSLQLLSLNNDSVYEVPVNILQYFVSGLFWTR